MTERPIVYINVTCVMCKKPYQVRMYKDEYQRWDGGAGGNLQEIMPEMSPGNRELLISRTCEPCFDELFPPVEGE